MVRIIACRYQATATTAARSGAAVVDESGRIKHIITQDGDVIPDAEIFNRKIMCTLFNYPLVW